MKRRLLTITTTLLAALCAMAQQVQVQWSLSDVNKLDDSQITGLSDASLLTTSYTQGSALVQVASLASSGAASGYTAVSYTPPFASFTPSTKVTSAQAAHSLTFNVKPAAGHTFKITRISFDAVKVGTDGGAIEAKATPKGGTSYTLPAINVLRNQVNANNPTAFAHNDFIISDLVATDAGLDLVIYLYNINGTDNSSPKALALRNITLEGVMDEEVYAASHYLTDLTASLTTRSGTSTTNLYQLIKDLKNGEAVRYTEKLTEVPTDFVAALSQSLPAGYQASTSYNEDNNSATISILNSDDATVFQFQMMFTVSKIIVKGEARPLTRGLMALHQSDGNLVSWRARKGDTRNYKYRLYRGTETSQNTKVNSGQFIMGRTNFKDKNAASGAYYRLEVYDDAGNIVERDTSYWGAWDNQTQYITLEGGAPTDPTTRGATYTPNDAAICDMDGDGIYDIVLKWQASNEKDAAGSGLTSPAFYACYRLDGKRLWMLHTGPNMFNSAHTTPFVAWDLDGDGFGEFMVKTAPGAVDANGNYILLGDDDPNANLLNGNGKQVSGPEYITIFDGATGTELQTIPYHTAYGDVTTSFWGDTNQNRSERYLAGIAWLDGEDANPSAIFARGYYSGCNIGAYDWDGENLTLRWLHRGDSFTSGTVTYADGTVKKMNSSAYQAGAHAFAVGDVTGDGRQEIIYGSAALNSDGTTLYNTRLGHGDALHLGDFIPSRPGQEYFMTLEHGNHGANLRDAATGEILWRITANDDTGRGIMAHFDPEAENAYWQTSINQSMLYDTEQNVIASNVSHGGGASLNNRIFWNGTLADDYYDKSVLEEWNPTAKGFWRMQVNGGNYTVGTLNNSSKYNPCILADLLGDWREEIVTWTKSTDGDYQLIINATNYETLYTLPHLMDDYAYRAQVIAQNSVYNQPPHVSYDPRTVKTIHPETFTADDGGYWGSLYTTYPVIVPEETVVYNITNRATNGTDTLRLRKIEAGSILPAESAVIFRSTTEQPGFIPTSLAATTSITSTYAKGFYCDSIVADQSAAKPAYVFRLGDRGPGFYRSNGATVQGGTAYALFGTTSQPGADSYVVGLSENSQADGIANITSDTPAAADETITMLTGIRLAAPPAHGVFIQGGKKYIR